jgi:hypothetical protein
MKAEHKAFYRDVIKELETGTLSIFAGAGLSVDAGHVNWKNLLQDITEDLGLDYNKETDLIAIAQYNKNKIGSRSQINKKIIDEFNRGLKPTPNHAILARLPIYTYWTTNYDNLIEKSLEAVKRIPDVKHSVSQLTNQIPRRDAIVYKMHGDATLPNEATIIKDDYERYSTEKAPFLTALNSDLLSKRFIFIGFSFTDPNLDYVLSRVRIHLREAQRHHYHFVKKLDKDQYIKDGMEADFDFDKRKQELFVNDLSRFGLQPVWVDTYPEITAILREIEDTHKRKTIFLSGSAEDYHSWDSQDGQAFIHKLSAELIAQEFRIVNGFGWGVGSAVINGALSQIYENPERFSRDQLIVRPFPQFATGGKTLEVLWNEYRNDMIDFAGVSVIVFGNKKEGTSSRVVEANGVYKEYEIAKAKKLFIIPVFPTGWMAEKIYSELESSHFGLENGDQLIPLMAELKTLTDPDKIIQQVIKIIKKLNT